MTYDQQTKLFELMKFRDHIQRNIHWLQKPSNDPTKQLMLPNEDNEAKIK